MLRIFSLWRGAVITLGAVLLVLALSAACGSKSSPGSTSTPGAQSPSAAPSQAGGAASASASDAANPTARAQAPSSANTAAGSTNEKWTRGLCSATQTWSDDITTLANGIDASKLDNTATAKDALVKFLSDARDRTQTFKSDVDRLGNPDGKDGKAIEQAFSDGAAQAVKVFDDAVKSAQNLNVTDDSELQDQISDIGEQLDKASDDLNDTFSSIDTKYDTTDLTTIAQNTPECAGLF